MILIIQNIGIKNIKNHKSKDSYLNNIIKCCPFCNEPIGKNFYIKECKNIQFYCCGKGNDGHFNCGKCNGEICVKNNFYYCNNCNVGIHLNCDKCC